MRYPDTVQLATTTTDGYGDKTVTVLTNSKALFVEKTAIQQNASAADIISDATVYLDPTNEIVKGNLYRLEGMYIIAKPFGGDVSDSWYRVQHVTVAQHKLLGNRIDNIHCHLEKESGVPYATTNVS